MTEKRNIDNLFENLKDFKAKSPSSGWANVSEKVFFNNIAANLQRLTVKTGDYLWDNIAKKLLWYNFLHFSYSTFNIFYLTAVLLVSSLLFLTFSDNNNTPSHQHLDNLMAMQPKAKQVSNSISVISNNETTPPLNNNVITNSSFNSLNKSKLAISSKTKTEKYFSETHDNQNNISSTPPTNTQTPSVAKKKKAFKLQTEIKQPLFKPTPKEKDFLVVDTFRVFDTIHYYDTLAVIQKNKLKTNDIKKGYSLNFYFASLFGKTNFSSIENPALADTNNKAMYGTMSISGGIDFEMALSQSVFLQTGIGLLKLSEDFSYKSTRLVVDTNVKPHYTSNTFYMYMNKPGYETDTTNIFPVVTYIHHVDGNITTDTTWYYKTDSVEVIAKDSVLHTKNDTTYETVYDTVTQHYFYEYANRYTYLQIPLIFGYKFGKGKLTYTVSGGIINELFLNAKGRGISFTNAYEVVDMNKEFPFMKYNVSYYLGAGIEYKLENNISFFAEGFYRKNVNSAFKNSFVLRKRFANYGIKTGIKVHF